MCGDFVGNNAFLHIVSVRQSEMFFRGYVAEHCASEPPDHRGTNTACDVIVAGSDVGRQWTERIKRSLIAMFELQIHILLDKVHRDMSWSLNHDLTIMVPSDFCEFTKRFQLCELRLIVRIGDRTRT